MTGRGPDGPHKQKALRLAKEKGMGYNSVMDILQRLEDQVRRLVSERRDLQGRLAEAEEKCSVLLEENRTMRQALDSREAVREEALARIDAALRKVEAQIGAEKVL